MSTVSPASSVKVAPTPSPSIFNGTDVRSTNRPAVDAKTAPTPDTS
jgi:hypothetical protein